MCGRFTLTWNEWRQVAGALGSEDEGDAAASYRPRFNIAPTDEHFIITSEFERRKARRARWGLVNCRARDNRRASQCINPKRKRSNSGHRSAKPASSAVESFQPMGSTNGPVPRASGRRSGFTRGTGA